MTPQDKRYNEYREACAKVDGFVPENRRMTCGNLVCEFSTKTEPPAYLLDGEIDAVVRKLSVPAVQSYHENLCKLRLDGIAFRARPEQKAEALCRTLIGWVL